MTEPESNYAKNDRDDLIIEGINVRDGLRRTLDNRALYLQMLIRFRDDHFDSVAKIRQALDHENDRQLAERLAHTLKGVAALVSATAVTEMADRLEERIHKGEDSKMLATLLGQLDAEMQALQKALAPMLPGKLQENNSAPSAGVDRQMAHDLIQRVAQLLTEYDADAIELLTKSKALLVAALGAAAHQKIAHAMRQFDFDGGLKALIESAEAAGYKIL